MSYTVSQLAKKSGVTSRTLRHYDEIGVLKPSFIGGNGYRYYEQKDLLRLQQILFFRELDFSLDKIAQILNQPNFDLIESLQYQQLLLKKKQQRLDQIIKTITKTIESMKEEQTMNDSDLYEGFSQEEIKQMKEEAYERWGNTDAYKQSQKRVKNFSKEDLTKMQEETDQNLRDLVQLMLEGKQVDDPAVQKEIRKHHASIERFYDCSAQMYKGLAEMYLADPRFTAFYQKYHQELPPFLVEGMKVFAEHGCKINE